MGRRKIDSYVRPDNFVLIQGWMLTDLNLKGNELMIYACIYGFSQIENHAFSGSLRFLGEWCNCSKQTVINTLNSLLDKGLLEKSERIVNNIKQCSYYALRYDFLALSHLSGQNFRLPVKNFDETGQKFRPNNISNNIYSSSSSHARVRENVENLEKTPEKGAKTVAEADSEAVDIKSLKLELMGGTLGERTLMISDRQFDKLCEYLSFDELHKYIEIIKDCERRGHKFSKSHYKAILDMAIEDRKV